MTNVKKVVAVMLAFLMIFSSASVLASAWDATADDGSALNIETKFFKEVGGEWVETTKVKPGDVVKARVYLSTDYYSNDSSLLFFYDKDFFTHSYSTTATERADVVNAEAGSFAAANNVTARVAADPIELRKLVAEGYIDSDFLNEYGAISTVVRVKSAGENNVMYDDSTWLLEYTLTVKDTATGEGDFFVKDTTVQNSTTQTNAAVNVPKGPANGTDADIWAMWLWDANVTLESNPVSTMSSITFNANTGAFADGSETYVVEGMIDDPVDAAAIPAVTKDGYAFMGWIDAADTTPTYDEILKAVPATIPENDLVLNAYWMETVDITFDTGAGSAIETITGAKPYDTFADIEDPVLDGYTFKGWDVKGGELPANYPDKDTTYTAIWAKQVTVSFDTDGAAAIPAVDGDAGDAFETVVDNPSKAGHYFIGWQPALPTVFPAEDTTYTALYETYSYRVEYYLDGKFTASTQIEYGMPIPTVVPTLEITAGEILDGWYTDADCSAKLAAGAKMPALAQGETYRLYATTSPATFNAIFMVDGEVYATVPTLYEADIAAPGTEDSDIAAPAKAGYTFEGWDPYPGTLDQPNDMTFNAIWTEAYNTIQYIVDGSEWETFTGVEYGAEFEIAADPVKDGYNFIGWTNVEGGTTPVALPATMPADSVVTYYAIFSVNEYTITFFTDGGTAVDPITQVYGTDVTAPAAPTKTGYTFAGWDNLPAKMPAENITVTALWTINQYTITFNTDGGTAVDPITQDYDTAVTAPADPTKTGYTFAGWDKEIPAKIPAEDMTITAKWTINQYTITFDTDGGSAVDAITQDYNTAVTAPAAPTKTGYAFAGWDKEIPTTMPAEDMTITAKWTINQYTITFDTDGGSAVDAITQDYNTAVTAPEAPTKTGHTFAGWDNLPATMPAENVTVKALWDVNKYTATWVFDNGAEDQVDTYDYNAAIVAPADPTKTGYTFTGWSPAVDSNMPAQNVSYTATWEANTYNAVFMVDGEVYETVPTKYDAEIKAPIDPEKAGYVFAGWEPAVGTMNSVDGLTFNAKWVNATDTKYTVITYTMNTAGQYVETSKEVLAGETGAAVDATPAALGAGFKFNADKSEEAGNILADSSLVLTVYIDREVYTLTTIVDDETTTKDYYFEQAVSVEAPSKAGYDFAGWNNAVPSKMPANDVTLTATWTARNDTVFYVVMNYTDDVSGDVKVDDRYELTGTTDSTVAVVEEIPAEAAENTTYVLVSDIEAYFSGVFAINHYNLDKSDVDVKINADGTTEVNVYYVPAEYEITFSSGDGAWADGTSKVVTLKYNQLVKPNAPAEEPVRTGYTFNGYTGLNDATRVAGKRTFTAAWNVNQYTITYDVDGVTRTETYDYNAPINKPTDPSKTGYTFTSWNPVIPDNMPAENITVAATWKVNSYNVTWDFDNGAEAQVDAYDYNATIVKPADPTKTGYTFNGWSPAVASNMPAENVTYTAQWSINQYTITFDTDGGSTVGAIKQNYNTAVTAPADPTKTGYTFKGWEPAVPATMPANDMTVKAIWEINQYEIKFDGQGGTPALETVKADYNSSVAAPAAPAKEGYTFKGWATTAGVTDASQAVSFPVTMPLNGTTYYAIWETNNYTITFDSKGGSAVAFATQAYLSSVAKPADPTLEGYTFGGWSATDGGTEAVTFPVTMPLNGATYYAIWTIETYTVNWVSEGTTAKSEPVNFGGALTAPTVEKTGYSLDGWYDANGNEVSATIGDIGNTGAAITYTAKWSANTYNAVFDANSGAWADGDTTKTVPTKFDDAIVAPANPVRAGYEFSTWEPTVGTMNSVDGLTFKAVWVADSDTKYTVETYTMNTAGTYDKTSEVKGAATDSIVNVKPASVAEGFKLNDTLSVYEGKVLADNSLVLKVYIDRESYNFNTAVTGGTTTTATSYLFGATVVVPEKEEKTGYTFDGWYYDGTKYEAGASFTMPAKDVTLTGTLTINQYTATWVFDNGTADQVDTYDYNEAIVAPTAPSKTGYTFAGWSPEVDETMPANNVTYTAQWTPNDYTITFTNTGDTAIAPITQAYLSDVTAPADPEKAGHTFAGWYDESGSKVNVPAKMPLGGMTLEAKWDVNKYLVTFYKDADKAEVVYSNEVDFGATLNGLTADPTKTGYTFAGWAYEGTTDKLDLTNETVPVGGVNLIALWEIESYTVNFRANNGKYEDGSDIKTTTVIFGNKVVAPEEPTRAGYVFNGWNPVLPEAIEDGAAVRNHTAQWKQETYSIKWVSFDQEVSGEDFASSATHNSDVVAPEMEKLGYTFNGWDYNGTTYAAGEYITIVDTNYADGAEIAITANWTANTYDAIFDANGGAWADGDVTKTVPTVFDTAIVAPADPTRAGYTFGTWEPAVGNMTAEGMTFKATWIADSDTKYTVETYTMNAEGEYDMTSEVKGAATDSIVNVKPASVAEGFKLNDTLSVYEGKVLADNSLVLKVYIDRETYTVTTTLDGKVTGTQDVLFGATVTVPADGVKEGYSFNGWTVNGTAYESGATFTMPAKNVAIDGTFTVNQYDAIFYVDGVVFATVPTNFGEVPAAPDATNAKPGYTFVEWSPALSAMTVAGAEYNAVFTANGDTPYTVEIYTMGLDGQYGEAAVENYTGATDTEAVYAPAVKEGFSVADSSILSGNIAADGSLVLKVYYSRNDYTITYNVDGSEYKVETYKYGADIAILAEPEKEGYTFSGWDATLDATMPAENLVINGTFSVNEYTITYNVDGAEYKVETYDYGTAITILADPEKEGHTFSGWDTVLPATMPANNIVVNGTFSANTYKITYNVDGAEYKVEEYVFGKAVTPLEAPVKEGYTFSGWDKAAPETMTAGDITISGTFTVNQYNAIFYVDGEVFATVPTDFGKVPVAPDATNAKAGYTFVEWTPALAEMTTAGAEYNAVFTANSETPYTVEIYTMGLDGQYGEAAVENYTGATDTEATYAPAVKEGFTVADESVLKGNIEGDGSLVLKVYYSRNKVTVDLNGEEDEYFYGEEITEPTRPTPPEGYEQPEVDGWEDQNGDPVNFPITVPDEDTTITPVFVPKNYKATFVFNDGATEEKTIAYLETVTAPTAPAIDGYKFIGWRDDAGAFLTDATTMPARDITYTAIYEITTSGVNYYVDGVLVGSASYEYGTVIPTVIPTYSTPVGYEFDGWYTDAACTTKLADGATFGAGVTALYAKEIAKTYDAIFMVDGEVYKTVPTAFDADIIAPEAPTKDGYTFAGWDPFVGTMDREGMTFTAQWTNDEYTITYIVDGEVYDEFAVEFGGEFEVPSDPDKAGYAFLGWAKSADATAAEVLPATMPAENLTYYAVFEITERTATFYGYEALDESPYKSDEPTEVLSSAKFNVGSAIEFPEAPTNIDSAYWTFLGWSATENGEVIADTSAVIMGEEDVSFYAVYEKVTVKLMPKAGTTTMIERNGAIESYNDGYTVSTEFVATTDSTKNLIYGLKVGLRDTAIADYVEVLGDGYTVVTAVQRGRLGTGTLVEVYDRNGTEDKADDILVEELYVVIFGDIDGNARLTVDDQKAIDKEVTNPSWSSVRTKVEYMFRAANLDGNRRLTLDDGILVTKAVTGTTLNQVTGKVG